MLCPDCGKEGIRIRSREEGTFKRILYVSDEGLGRFETLDDFLAWLDGEAGESLAVAEALARLDWPEGWPPVADHVDFGDDETYEHVLSCPSCGARFEVTDRWTEADGEAFQEWDLRPLGRKAKSGGSDALPAV